MPTSRVRLRSAAVLTAVLAGAALFVRCGDGSDGPKKPATGGGKPSMTNPMAESGLNAPPAGAGAAQVQVGAHRPEVRGVALQRLEGRAPVEEQVAQLELVGGVGRARVDDAPSHQLLTSVRHHRPSVAPARLRHRRVAGGTVGATTHG